MKNEEILEMIRGWTDSRLALEIDQSAAHAVDTNRSNDSAFAATAALMLMLREKERRG